ncbi:MAG: hypothetical protein WBY94_01795, partial [Polyangiaceae bacterium]
MDRRFTLDQIAVHVADAAAERPGSAKSSRWSVSSRRRWLAVCLEWAYPEKREGSDVVFSIVSCPLPLHDLPVDYVAVFKEGRRDQEPDCKLVSTKVGATVLKLKHWKYGSEPEGFRLGPCAPLLPDVKYTIHVSAIGVGERRFTLKQDGARFVATTLRLRLTRARLPSGHFRWTRRGADEKSQQRLMGPR